MEKLQEGIDKLKNTISKMRYNQKEMKGQINNLEGMLKALMVAQGIQWNDEDDQETEEISPLGEYS